MPPDAPPAAPAPHGPSAGALLGTAAALLALTGITVVASRLELGAANLVVALAIAALKAALVATFFMHLRYEHRLQAVILVVALAFVAVFMGFVVLDTTRYQPDLQAALEALRREAAAR